MLANRLHLRHSEPLQRKARHSLETTNPCYSNFPNIERLNGVRFLKEEGKQEKMKIKDRYRGREEGSKEYGGNKERSIGGRKGCDSKSEEGRKSKKEDGGEKKAKREKGRVQAGG